MSFYCSFLWVNKPLVWNAPWFHFQQFSVKLIEVEMYIPTNTVPLHLTHLPLDKMAAILQTIFTNAFSSTKMYEFHLRFHWSLFPRFQSTIFHHWFRQWLGTNQATSHYLNQWWLVYWCIYGSLSLNKLIRHGIIIAHTITIHWSVMDNEHNIQVSWMKGTGHINVLYLLLECVVKYLQCLVKCIAMQR